MAVTSSYRRIMKAKRRSNAGGPKRVRLQHPRIFLQLLQLSSLISFLFLVFVTQLDSNNNNSNNKQMPVVVQAAAFVVTPPLVVKQTNQQQQPKSSSSCSHLVVVFGRSLPTTRELSCNNNAQTKDMYGLVETSAIPPMPSRRRLFLSTAAAAANAAAAALPLLLLLPPLVAPAANAVVMENTQTTFKAGEAISIEAAKARLQEARASLQYLVENYDDIIKKGGGDNVRRYLGTVGTSSGLYGISKVLKTLQEEADDNDMVDYTELVYDFEQALRDADTACYSAIFVEFSAAKTPPEKFFIDAKGDVARMQKYFNELTGLLHL